MTCGWPSFATQTKGVDALRTMLDLHQVPWRLVGHNLVVVPSRDPLDDLRRHKAQLTLELELRELERKLREDAAQPAATAPAAPAKGWPRVGQHFVFQLEGNLRMTWEVTDVLGSRVSYTITTHLGNQSIGKPISQVWNPTELPPTDATPVRKTLGGVSFDVLAVRSDAGVDSWIAVHQRRMRFPGVLWMQKDGIDTMRLNEVR